MAKRPAKPKAAKVAKPKAPSIAKPRAAKKPAIVFAGTHPAMANAYGLSLKRPGFAIDDEHDTLFALGFPHLVISTDEPVPELDDKAVEKRYPRWQPRVPRALLFRKFALGRTFKDPAYRDALKPDAPPRAAIALSLQFGGGLFLLEAIHGSATVLETLCIELEEADASEFGLGRYKNYGWSMLRQVHFLLLRVDAATRTAALARLEAVFARVAERGFSRSLKGLDIALHGRIAFERSARMLQMPERPSFGDLVHIDDDPEFVASTLERLMAGSPRSDRGHFDARLAFVAGPRGPDLVRGHTYHSSSKAELAAHLPLIA